MASPREELLLMLSLLLRFVPVALPAAITEAAASAAAVATSSADVPAPTACDLTDAASQARARASAAPPPTAELVALDGFVGEGLSLLGPGVSCRVLMLHPELVPPPMIPLYSCCGVQGTPRASHKPNGRRLSSGPDWHIRACSNMTQGVHGRSVWAI